MAAWLAHGERNTYVSFSSGEASRDLRAEANHCAATMRIGTPEQYYVKQVSRYSQRYLLDGAIVVRDLLMQSAIRALFAASSQTTHHNI